MVRFDGGAAAEVTRTQLAASFLAGVFLDGALLVGFMGVERFHVLFLELGQVVSIEFAFLLFLLEGAVEHLGQLPYFLIRQLHNNKLIQDTNIVITSFAISSDMQITVGGILCPT